MPLSAQMRTPWFYLKVGQDPPLWREGEGGVHVLTLHPCIPGDEVYSTIRKQEYNGKIPRFRRIRGDSELYTSDTVMQSESGSS